MNQTHKRSAVRAVLVTSNAVSLTNFRGPLIQAMVQAGIEVYALAPDYDNDTRSDVTALGAKTVDFPMTRTGLTPLKDLRSIVELVKAFGHIRPDVVINCFVKPVIYGSIAARLAGIPSCFSLIEGLGYLFTPNASGNAVKRRVVAFGVRRLYSIALRCNQKVFFLNQDDMREFVDGRVLSASKVVLLPGIGVDLDLFAKAPPVLSPVTFLWAGRLLREKGICDFVAAARFVRQKYPDVRFIALGGTDANPGSLSEREVRNWVDEGLLEWPGKVRDVRPWLSQTSVFVLPSSYREGKPRSTQEAMAMGRPIITTDSPGCRETVEHGRNGFLVPPRNPEALAGAMTRFIEDPSLIVKMGSESRKMAEEMYDVHKINRLILNTIGIG